MLREGDVLAHPFTRHPGGFVNREGEVHPVIQAALDRGLKVDVGHGSHFSYRLAKKALAAGIVPHHASARTFTATTPTCLRLPARADQHEDDENHPFAGQAKFSLVQAMSSMMALGLPLEQVVPMVTSNPARMLGRADEIGALKVGRESRRLGDRRTNRAILSFATTRTMKLSPSVCCSPRSACAPVRDTTRWRQSLPQAVAA